MSRDSVILRLGMKSRYDPVGIVVVSKILGFFVFALKTWGKHGTLKLHIVWHLGR